MSSKKTETTEINNTEIMSSMGVKAEEFVGGSRTQYYHPFLNRQWFSVKKNNIGYKSIGISNEIRTTLPYTGVMKPSELIDPDTCRSISSEKIDTSDEDMATVLPDTYKTLSRLFSMMLTSIRLCILRKQQPTLYKLKGMIEAMGGRPFGSSHFAKMLYILPDAIRVKRCMWFDPKIKVFKPDFDINVVFDIVHGHNQFSNYLALEELFDQRLIQYFEAHPNVIDIPESALP